MKILHIASEMYPLLKTGGLADVVGALPFAQQQRGDDVRVLLPAHPDIVSALGKHQVVAQLTTFAGEVTLRYGEFNGLGIYLLDAPHLFAREGNPYHDSHYQDYPDNYLRWALLGFVGAEVATGRDAWWQPDVAHVHDWHAGLTCAYLRARQATVKSVFTIHNIAYQGLFSAHHLHEIALPHDYFQIEGLEFNGQLSYLKAGIYYADEVTTVSPTFAQELTQEAYSFGLHGLLQTLSRSGRLHGVLNGIDDTVWNPATDACVSPHYKIGSMQGKLKNKVALQQRFGLSVNKAALLFVMVTRLTEQKGVDLFLDSIERILKQKGQLIVLGSGAPEFEQALTALAAQHPRHIGVHIGYDEDLAHAVIAGGDVIVVPSRFEPCGLTQLYGLRYGTLPLVRQTGGLADTVVDVNETHLKNRTATGFVFQAATSKALQQAIGNAFTLWKTPRQWNSVRATAMRQDNSWEQAAENYSLLYLSR